MNEPLRCFVALLLPDAAREALERHRAELLEQPWAEAVRWVPPESFHITLHFLGDLPAAQLTEITQVVERCATRAHPLSLALTRLTGFPTGSRARVLVAAVDDDPALDALFRDLEAELGRLGLASERRRFRPHVTLGRVRRPPLRARIGATIPRQPFAVRELHLMQSRLGPGGARYEVLHGTPLGPPLD